MRRPAGSGRTFCQRAFCATTSGVLGICCGSRPQRSRPRLRAPFGDGALRASCGSFLLRSHQHLIAPFLCALTEVYQLLGQPSSLTPAALLAPLCGRAPPRSTRCLPGERDVALGLYLPSRVGNGRKLGALRCALGMLTQSASCVWLRLAPSSTAGVVLRLSPQVGGRPHLPLSRRSRRRWGRSGSTCFAREPYWRCGCQRQSSLTKQWFDGDRRFPI